MNIWAKFALVMLLWLLLGLLIGPPVGRWLKRNYPPD